ncbi:hypothetical protein HK096_004709, partial [Nowakowskiella sp. JEL0078]
MGKKKKAASSIVRGYATSSTPSAASLKALKEIADGPPNQLSESKALNPETDSHIDSNDPQKSVVPAILTGSEAIGTIDAAWDDDAYVAAAALTSHVLGKIDADLAKDDQIKQTIASDPSIFKMSDKSSSLNATLETELLVAVQKF